MLPGWEAEVWERGPLAKGPCGPQAKAHEWQSRALVVTQLHRCSTMSPADGVGLWPLFCPTRRGKHRNRGFMRKLSLLTSARSCSATEALLADAQIMEASLVLHHW
jgi:hypothetical protein